MQDSRKSGLSPDQRNRLDELLDELFDLPEEDRLRELHSREIHDSVVLAEAESLLRAANASIDFLSSPARPPLDHVAPDPLIGSRIGPWRVIRLIGRGGMGEVYEAVRARGDFAQRVAIKLLQADAAAQQERFHEERQILARLEHFNIARLYDGGVTSGGRPFMVMEYVEGTPITDFCAATRAALERRLELFSQVCEAVAYAHRNLIVHRDLKPSNILVTKDGEIKLLDFGIAKLLDTERPHLTRAAAAPLTPICAAPEQLLGEPVTTATDVYALGLLLFELLTGKHPWVGTDTPILQAMRTVLQRSAPLASRTAEEAGDAPVPVRLIRGDLDAIVAKTLRAEPSRRYVTVESLKIDVERASHGEAVEAREGARLYVLGRLLRRYSWEAAALVAIVISLAGGLSAAAWQAHRASIERDTARRDAAREEAVRYNLTRLFRTAIEDHGSQAPTAKNMIDNSAQRVLREYRDQPQLAGQIVLTLADLYGALEDVTGADTLLEGFVSEANPDADPAALADARQKLANIELLRGHTDRAGQLLDRAEAFWTTSQKPYAEERLEGLTVRARWLRARGDLNGAIETTREAIRQRIQLSGHNHRETAVLYNSLAISLAAANRLDEALAAYHETTAIYDALGSGDGLDAQIIVANTGTLEFRAGHLREAEVLLKGAVERERSLAGDSAAVGAALGYYGKVLAITNRIDPALAALREATDVATHYVGANSPVALQNRLFLGETQLVSGNRRDADVTLKAVEEAALGQYGASHALTLRAQVALAQLAAAQGNYTDAQSRLERSVEALRKVGAASEPTLALALENLGDAQLHLDQVPTAKTNLQEAVSLREKHPGDLWELAEARERLGEALAKAGSGDASALLKQAAHDLELELGADHPQTIRAKSALSQLHT